MDKKIDSNILRTERRIRWIKRGVIVAVAVMAVSAGLWMIGTSVNRRDLFIATVDNGPLEITAVCARACVPPCVLPTATRTLSPVSPPEPISKVRATMSCL